MQQDLQTVAFVPQQKVLAGFDNGIVVIEPVLKVRREDIDQMTCLLQQLQAVLADFILVMQKQAGRRYLCVRADGGRRVVDAELAGRDKLGGCVFILFRRFRRNLPLHIYSLLLSMSMCGMPASMNSSLTALKPSRS